MKNKVTVFIDLDGVLVDWLNGIREFAGKPTDLYDCFRQDPHSLNQTSVDTLFGGRPILQKLQYEMSAKWWAELQLFPWAKYLIDTMSNNFDMAFLTSPGKCYNAAAGKVMWQHEHYKDTPIIMTKHKYLAASPTKVLIDDDDWQLTRFDRAGGLAIKWPNQFALENQSIELAIKPFIQNLVKTIKEYELKIN